MAEPSKTTSSRSASDLGSGEGPRRSISDQPTDIDSIGFHPYVQALGEFLVNSQTEPPLTISIEGEWGSGKSSFMMQLAGELDRLGRGGFLRRCVSFFIGSRTRIVWFNAWRHDKVDSIYAGFAIRFLEEIRKKTPVFRSIFAFCYLGFKRFDWSSGGFLTFVRVVALWLFFISSASFIATRGVPALYDLWDGLERQAHQIATGTAAPAPQERADPFKAFKDLIDAHKQDPLASNLFKAARQVGILDFAKLINANAQVIASWTGYFLILLLLLERIAKLSDPIRLEAKKRTLVPDYEKSLAFVEQFHRDLANVVDAYLGNPFDFLESMFRQRVSVFRHRVFVFIDDLDRCEIPRAADLIQGLNLLISDSPKIVFILGIDRQKIAAALAVKYKEFLPYFPVSHFSGNNGSSKKANPADFDPTPGLEFGYSFLEKFIQLSFFVPTMRRKRLQEFLSGLEPKPVGILTLRSLFNRKPNTKDTSGSSSQPVPADVANDSADVLKIARVVARGFRYNPRRLKQFLNLFRLQRFIAYHTNQLSPNNPKGATLEQLGKFVAILLRWPSLLPDLIMFPTFLEDLGNSAKSTRPSVESNVETPDPERLRKERIAYWCDRVGFLALLLASPVQEDQDDEEDQEDQKNLPKNWAEIPAEWRLDSFKIGSFLHVRAGVIPILPLSKKRYRSRNGTEQSSEWAKEPQQSETDFVEGKFPRQDRFPPKMS